MEAEKDRQALNGTQSQNKTEDLKKSSENAESKKSGSKIPLIIAITVCVLAGLVYLFICLSPAVTAKIRDVSLIIYVLESVVSVVAFVVLCVQVARLVNFLKYEIAPILDTTNKTVKKVSGTVSFLSDNAVEPAVKAASTISGIKNAINGILGVFKRP
jgi:hypothetical protein